MASRLPPLENCGETRGLEALAVSLSVADLVSAPSGTRCCAGSQRTGIEQAPGCSFRWTEDGVTSLGSVVASPPEAIAPAAWLLSWTTSSAAARLALMLWAGAAVPYGRYRFVERPRAAPLPHRLRKQHRDCAARRWSDADSRAVGRSSSPPCAAARLKDVQAQSLGCASASAPGSEKRLPFRSGYARRRLELRPGAFGENLTTSGVDVSGTVIAERWRIGSASLRCASRASPVTSSGSRSVIPAWFAAPRSLVALTIAIVINRHPQEI
jgi:hypothetical protein